MQCKMRLVDTGGGVYYPYQSEQANKLGRVSFVNGGSAGTGTGAGWYKIFEVTCSSTNYDVYSAILLANGVYKTQASATADTRRSGLIEINCRINTQSGSTTESTISILCGNLAPELFGITVQDKTFSVYYNATEGIPIDNFVLLDESAERIDRWMSTMGASYYGADEPSDLIYGAVRSRASEDQDGNELVNTSTDQTITGTKSYTRFPAAMLRPQWDVTTPPSYVRYAQLAIWRDTNNKNIGQIESYQNEDGDTAVYFMNGSADGSSWRGRLGLGRRTDGTEFTICTDPQADSNTNEIATTKWVNDKGYLKEVPAASQTVLGGVRAYVDSEGYFCIDNT